MKEKIFVKKVRARAKTQYHKLKQMECFVCGSSTNLELHHVIPLSVIIKEYLNQKEGGGKTDEKLVSLILEECTEIFMPKNCITLCKIHHSSLHNLFGMSYSRKTAEKTRTYLIKQKEKVYGKIH